MHDSGLLLTLTGGLTAAVILGYITHRIGLSPIVGYLLAGVTVSSYTPGFAADATLTRELAEVGVILLMFGVGLHFHFDELLAVRRIAVPGAIVQSLAATLLAALFTHLFGWSWTEGIVYGLAISVASTVVLTRVLTDNNDLHTPTGHIAVGWLVVEDLFTVVLLVLLPALFPKPSPDPLAEPAAAVSLVDVLLTLGMVALQIIALVGLTIVLGGRLIPWLLGQVAATRSRELFTLATLVVALGIAVGSVKVFHVSMELGAFLAGMIVGRSEFSLRAASDALPMRDAFAVLFFVSVGMRLNPLALWDAPGLATVTLAIIVIGKPFAAAAIVLLLRYPLKTALSVAVALGQIGEFSFILADLGMDHQLLPEPATNALVSAAIVSISLNPLLYRLVDPLDAWIARRPRLAAWLSRRATPTVAPAVPPNLRDARYRAVLVGYGPVGRTLSRLLRDNEIQPTIVEMNLETVRALRAEKTNVVYGDASHIDTLKSAGVDQAGTLILSASDIPGAKEMIRQARELNPALRVLVRSTYLQDRAALRKAGADEIFAAEGEVALAMTEAILRTLGATAEQIDRERERVRRDLFGAPEDTSKG